MMKRWMIMMLTALCVWLAWGEAVYARRVKTDGKKEAAIEKNINNRTYKICATRAYPQTGSSITLTYPYSLRVSKDTADVYLPYYGRAYSLPYGGGEGLTFKGLMKDYQQTKVKNRYDITFSVLTNEDHYTFALSVYPSGESSIMVRMNNKQSISFGGDVDY